MSKSAINYGTEPAEVDQTAVHNVDVQHIANILATQAGSLMGEAAGATQDLNKHVIRRVSETLDRTENYFESCVEGQDPLDFTVSFPDPLALREFPSVERIRAIESPPLVTILILIRKTWLEVIGGQSKDRASGMNKHDGGRFGENVKAVRVRLKHFERALEQGDYPEVPDGVGYPANDNEE